MPSIDEEDDKVPAQGYGLVQPPAKVPYQEDDPEHGMDMAQKMAFRKHNAAHDPVSAEEFPIIKTAPVRNDINDMQDARELLQPAPVRRLEDAATQRLRQSPMVMKAIEAASKPLQRYADWVQSAPLEPKAYKERREAEEAADAGKRQYEDAVRQLMGNPEPVEGIRRPVSMQREFSNDQEKEAYLERVRQAMKKAAAAK